MALCVWLRFGERELSFDRAAIGLILTAHWLLLHARQPCTQHNASPRLASPLLALPTPTPQLPAIPVPSVLFSLASNLKCLHLIVRGNEPKTDVNYDPGDNVENDHWQSVSLDNTAEVFNSDDETRQSLYYLWRTSEWSRAPHSICFYSRKVDIPMSFKTIKKGSLIL